MRSLALTLLLFSQLLLATASAAEPGTRANTAAPIGVLPDINQDYLEFMAGRKPQQVDYYGGPHARRDVIELLLLQQALALGKFAHPLSFTREENYFRSIRNVQDGKTLTMAGTIWLEDLESVKEQVYISPPLVRNGEFVVGLYTSQDNLLALSSKTLSELIQLRAVTSRQWKPDLEALNQLGFHKIMYTPNWVNMARMIQARRVDLTLAPFEPSADLHIQVENIKLVPVSGVKVAIPGSRHWPISRAHPLGMEFYQALERGLAIMRSQGTIERAYRECGFFQSAVDDWTLLNPPTKADLAP